MKTLLTALTVAVLSTAPAFAANESLVNYTGGSHYIGKYRNAVSYRYFRAGEYINVLKINGNTTLFCGISYLSGSSSPFEYNYLYNGLSTVAPVNDIYLIACVKVGGYTGDNLIAITTDHTRNQRTTVPDIDPVDLDKLTRVMKSIN